VVRCITGSRKVIPGNKPVTRDDDDDDDDDDNNTETMTFIIS
jgi:hypothetical protein